MPVFPEFKAGEALGKVNWLRMREDEWEISRLTFIDVYGRMLILSQILSKLSVSLPYLTLMI